MFAAGTPGLCGDALFVLRINGDFGGIVAGVGNMGCSFRAELR
jgi:hypothetical protein